MNGKFECRYKRGYWHACIAGIDTEWHGCYFYIRPDTYINYIWCFYILLHRPTGGWSGELFQRLLPGLCIFQSQKTQSSLCTFLGSVNQTYSTFPAWNISFKPFPIDPKTIFVINAFFNSGPWLEKCHIWQIGTN